MTHKLLFGFDEQLSKWACERIPWAAYNEGMRAVGVADGSEADSKLLCVVVYHNYYPPMNVRGEEWYNTVEISIAAASPRWATRRSIINLLRVPFTTYKVRKVRLIVPSTNKRALRFAEGIGFTPEGTLRHEYAKGVHACVLGLLKSEFESPHFLRKQKKRGKSRQPNGQIHAVSAAVA